MTKQVNVFLDLPTDFQISETMQLVLAILTRHNVRVFTRPSPENISSSSSQPQPSSLSDAIKNVEQTTLQTIVVSTNERIAPEIEHNNAIFYYVDPVTAPNVRYEIGLLLLALPINVLKQALEYQTDEEKDEHTDAYENKKQLNERFNETCRLLFTDNLLSELYEEYKNKEKDSSFVRYYKQQMFDLVREYLKKHEEKVIQWQTKCCSNKQINFSKNQYGRMKRLFSAPLMVGMLQQNLSQLPLIEIGYDAYIEKKNRYTLDISQSERDTASKLYNIKERLILDICATYADEVADLQFRLLTAEKIEEVLEKIPYKEITDWFGESNIRPIRNKTSEALKKYFENLLQTTPLAQLYHECVISDADSAAVRQKKQNTFYFIRTYVNNNVSKVLEWQSKISIDKKLNLQQQTWDDFLNPFPNHANDTPADRSLKSIIRQAQKDILKSVFSEIPISCIKLFGQYNRMVQALKVYWREHPDNVIKLQEEIVAENIIKYCKEDQRLETELLQRTLDEIQTPQAHYASVFSCLMIDIRQRLIQLISDLKNQEDTIERGQLRQTFKNWLVEKEKAHRKWLSDWAHQLGSIERVCEEFKESTVFLHFKNALMSNETQYTEEEDKYPFGKQFLTTQFKSANEWKMQTSIQDYLREEKDHKNVINNAENVSNLLENFTLSELTAIIRRSQLSEHEKNTLLEKSTLSYFLDKGMQSIKDRQFSSEIDEMLSTLLQCYPWFELERQLCEKNQVTMNWDRPSFHQQYIRRAFNSFFSNHKEYFIRWQSQFVPTVLSNLLKTINNEKPAVLTLKEEHDIYSLLITNHKFTLLEHIDKISDDYIDAVKKETLKVKILNICQSENVIAKQLELPICALINALDIILHRLQQPALNDQQERQNLEAEKNSLIELLLKRAPIRVLRYEIKQFVATKYANESEDDQLDKIAQVRSTIREYRKDQEIEEKVKAWQDQLNIDMSAPRIQLEVLTILHEGIDQSLQMLIEKEKDLKSRAEANKDGVVYLAIGQLDRIKTNVNDKINSIKSQKLLPNPANAIQEVYSSYIKVTTTVGNKLEEIDKEERTWVDSFREVLTDTLKAIAAIFKRHLIKSTHAVLKESQKLVDKTFLEVSDKTGWQFFKPAIVDENANSVSVQAAVASCA